MANPKEIIGYFLRPLNKTLNVFVFIVLLLTGIILMTMGEQIVYGSLVIIGAALYVIFIRLDNLEART